MQGGYNRKSSATKILNGTFNVTKSPTENVRIDAIDDITPPSYLSDYALECWNEYAQLLKNSKVLTKADVMVLEKLCAAYQIYRVAYEDIVRNGTMIEHPSRGPVKNPAYDIWKGAMAETRQHGALLGLDPFDRGRLDVFEAEKKDNAFADI